MVVPSAAYWADSGSRKSPRSLAPVFVGIGDAIYNTADPRLPRAQKPQPPRFGMFTAAAATSAPPLALPRLVGSSAELDACARAWNGPGVLLKGAGASRDGLTGALRQNPAVLHFATHFLSASGSAPSGLIALSLNPSGETELLSAEEIAHYRVGAELVVLSGCDSAQGAVLPGTGLLGLTRAWLVAGAASVIASHWNTPDDGASFFASLYTSLRAQSRPDAAEALRAAQLEMIRAGGWRASPRFWGAYLAVGKQ